ncbi:hypothetical protein ACLK1S_14335 [Escherichia coli]
MVYASRVKKNPLLSRVHESDRFFREKQADVETGPFTFGDWLVLIVLTAVMVWVIWGVIVMPCHSRNCQPVLHHGSGDWHHRRCFPP